MEAVGILGTTYGRRRTLVVIGGTGRTLTNLRADAARLGVEDRVRIVGHVPDSDLPAFYSGASAFLYPTSFEGFGFPVLEAMRSRTPVIVFPSAAIPEIADGAALYPDRLDAHGVATALMRLEDDRQLTDQLVEAGAVRAQMFTWQRTAERTAAVYRRVATR